LTAAEKETGLGAAGYNADVAAGVDRGRTAAALGAGGYNADV